MHTALSFTQLHNTFIHLPIVTNELNVLHIYSKNRINNVDPVILIFAIILLVPVGGAGVGPGG